MKMSQIKRKYLRDFAYICNVKFYIFRIKYF